MDADAPSTPGTAHPRLTALRRVLTRVPFTITFVLVMVAVGLATGTLTSPTEDQPWFHDVATGYPALAEGRWWTLFTSIFFLNAPIVYVVLIPLVIGGFAWAEWCFGAARTALLFIVGHLVGILGAAGIIALLLPTGWSWAQHLATSYDLGPSAGAVTALVFAIATLRAPWRLRARLTIGLWAGISMLYLGEVYDLEHAVAVAFGLIVSGWLPAFRHPAGRPSQREWRLIAVAGMVAIGATQVINLIVPLNGPLGQNQPVASFIDVAIDVVVILLIADGVRRGLRVAWIAALTLGAFNLLSSALVLTFLPVLVELEAFGSISHVLGLSVAPAIFWAAYMVYLIVARSAFRVRFRSGKRTLAAPPLNRDELVTRLRRFGGGTISWMTTWEGNQVVGSGEGALAYQAHAGVSILLGDPVTAAGEEHAALESFARISEQAGLVPCAFSLSETAAAARPDGWRAVIVAEDTIVDLPELAFTGKAWGDVRTAMNRAGREDITFRMVTLADEPWNVLAQVRAISEQWAGDKGLPEMRFTLGTVDEALDREVRVGIAVDTEGNLHGVTSWLPVYGQAGADGSARVVGWTLDLMRRRDGGFGPVMEFLIASSAKHFSEAGYEFVSLSGAPLVRPADAEAGPVDQVLGQLGGLIEPLYGFQSLHRFKQKFNPRHASMYLLYRDEGDLPRIGIALTRAYLPDASLRDLVSSASTAGQH